MQPTVDVGLEQSEAIKTVSDRREKHPVGNWEAVRGGDSVYPV